MMTSIKNLDNALSKRDIIPPRQKDYKTKADYIFAKTIYKRFPKRLNEPYEADFPESPELQEIWRWANGEAGIGLIKPNYKFLSYEQSMEVRRDLYLDSPVNWLKNLVPVFSAPNGYYICLHLVDAEVYAINLTSLKALLVAPSLETYFDYLALVNERGCFKRGDTDEDDPEQYTESELAALEDLGLHGFFPITRSEKTVLDKLLD